MLLRADVFEEEEEFVVQVELPGAGEHAVEIRVGETVVTVRGHPRETTAAARTYHLRERPQGPYERHIPLPGPVRRGEARAVRRDGMLEIRLPRGEKPAADFVPVPLRRRQARPRRSRAAGESGR